MNVRRLQKALAQALTGLGYEVYDDALKAATAAQLPAVVVGIPDKVTLLNKSRADVEIPVHVLLSTADTDDALQRLSDSIEYRADRDSVLGAIMRATSDCWQGIDVDSISGFALIQIGANTSALACDINLIVHAVQTND